MTVQNTRRKPIRHVLHLVLTILTGGLWGLVWLVLVLRRITDGR
jgi:hypothetical protein